MIFEVKRLGLSTSLMPCEGAVEAEPKAGEDPEVAAASPTWQVELDLVGLVALLDEHKSVRLSAGNPPVLILGLPF